MRVPVTVPSPGPALLTVRLRRGAAVARQRHAPFGAATGYDRLDPATSISMSSPISVPPRSVADQRTSGAAGEGPIRHAARGEPRNRKVVNGIIEAEPGPASDDDLLVLVKRHGADRSAWGPRVSSLEDAVPAGEARVAQVSFRREAHQAPNRDWCSGSGSRRQRSCRWRRMARS